MKRSVMVNGRNCYVGQTKFVIVGLVKIGVILDHMSNAMKLIGPFKGEG